MPQEQRAFSGNPQVSFGVNNIKKGMESQLESIDKGKADINVIITSFPELQ